MSELGQQLREARLQKGMSLDDVQEMTKIRKRYLEAIEAGDYKVLPGSFYVRAFIKTYAEAVGLNPDELLEGHHQDVPKPQPEQTMEPVIQKRAQRASSGRSASWLPSVLMWTFPILIIAVIYMYATVWSDNTPDDQTPPVTQNDPSGQETPSGEQTPPAAPEGGQGGGTDTGESTDTGEEKPAEDQEEEPKEEEPADESQVTVTQDRTSGKYTYFKVAAPSETPVKVEIKASGQSWVEVYRGYDSSGEKIYFDNIQAGETISVDLDSQGMYIKSGYSPATEITVGGSVVTDGKTSSRIFLEPAETAAGTEGSGE